MIYDLLFVLPLSSYFGEVTNTEHFPGHMQAAVSTAERRCGKEEHRGLLWHGYGAENQERQQPTKIYLGFENSIEIQQELNISDSDQSRSFELGDVNANAFDEP